MPVGRDGVLQGGREGMLRGQTIGRAEYRQAGLPSEDGAKALGVPQVAADITAAVEIEQDAVSL